MSEVCGNMRIDWRLPPGCVATKNAEGTWEAWDVSKNRVAKFVGKLTFNPDDGIQAEAEKILGSSDYMGRPESYWRELDRQVRAGKLDDVVDELGRIRALFEVKEANVVREAVAFFRDVKKEPGWFGRKKELDEAKRFGLILAAFVEALHAI